MQSVNTYTSYENSVKTEKKITITNYIKSKLKNASEKISSYKRNTASGA